MNWPLLRVTVARWQHCRGSSSKVGRWERVQLGKTVPQPKGNLRDLPFHGSGVGLQKVHCQFRYLLSSFFLLGRFIPNFGNLLNLISCTTTGYFRWYLFLSFFFMYFFRNPHV